MPSQRVIVEKSGASRQRAPKGYARSTFDTLTSADNRAMVTSIAAFGLLGRMAARAGMNYNEYPRIITEEGSTYYDVGL